MINDSHAWALRPRFGWLRRWVDYATTQTDAPAIFHIGTGLSLLSAALPQFLYTRGPGGSRVQPNLYILYVGRSVADRKSTCVRMPPRVLSNIPQLEQRLGAFPVTPRALIEALSGTPPQLWSKDEFSTFLSQARGNSYAEPVKTKLTEAYDGGPLDERTIKSGVQLVKDYRVSLNAGCSVSYLQTYITPADMTGGFFARWMVVYGHRTRYIHWRDIPSRPDVEQTLGEDLGWIAQMCPDGEVLLTPEAEDVRAHFGGRLDSFIKDSSIKEAKQGALGRVELLATKIAMLIAADWYVSAKLDKGIRTEPTPNERLTITGEVMVTATNIAWAHARCVDKLVDRLRTNEFNRAKDCIVDLMKADTLYDLRQIANMVELGNKKLHLEVLDMLVTQGTLATTMGPGGVTYWSKSGVETFTSSSLPLGWSENLPGTPVLSPEWFDRPEGRAPAPEPTGQSPGMFAAAPAAPTMAPQPAQTHQQPQANNDPWAGASYANDYLSED